MLTKLKHILNTYTDEQLNDMTLWINSSDEVNAILIDEYNIDLILKDTELKINGSVTYEKE